MPLIETVLYEDVPCKATLTRETGATVTVGKNVAHNEDFKLTARNGYQFWKIALYPVDDKQMIKQQNNYIIIKTREKKRLCKFYIYKETQLLSLPRY